MWKKRESGAGGQETHSIAGRTTEGKCVMHSALIMLEMGNRPVFEVYIPHTVQENDPR